MQDDPTGRVSPFGNLRIKGYSHLPTAYRSVLRPSSPLNAKASTKCPLRRLIAPYTKAESNLSIYGTQAIHMNAVKLHMQMFLRSNSLTLSNSCHIMANSFQYIYFNRSLVFSIMVGTGRFELPTSRLSVVRSNQLSYAPVYILEGIHGQ